MKFEIITLFPDYFGLPLKQSLLGKAIDKRLFDIDIIDLRRFATDKHRTVDDTPFGGGGGMVMKVEPLDLCLRELGYERSDNENSSKETGRIILTSAAGLLFSQKAAIRFSLEERVTIICGHYLGVDERINDLYDITPLSIGDYVLTGGEPAALVMVDAVARLIPGLLGNFESALNDSHMNQLLGSPCYTRPAEYEGHEVPPVLLSGNHADIERFRRRKAIESCASRRPDILKKAELSESDLDIVNDMKNVNDNK